MAWTTRETFISDIHSNRVFSLAASIPSLFTCLLLLLALPLTVLAGGALADSASEQINTSSAPSIFLAAKQKVLQAKKKKKPTPPDPTSPTDGVKIAGTKITLTWSAVPGVKKYQVAMASGSRKYKKTKWIKGTSFTVNTKQGNTFAWKVRSKSGKRKSKWCSSQVFYVNNQCVESSYPTHMDLEKDFAEKSIYVSTVSGQACEWQGTITSGANWISFKYNGYGKGSDNMKFYVEENKDDKDRTGSITVEGFTTTIKQAGNVALAGFWNLYFTYQGSSETKASMRLHDSGFAELYASTATYIGDWSYVGSTVKLKFEAYSGSSSYVTYTGALKQPAYMEGTMKSYSGTPGTWWAIKKTIVK
ncbi:hypothetical protein OAO01_08195 [Oligoflexia bacterium]|nr:hypothetical protein [Oligoflexia bacterium]